MLTEQGWGFTNKIFARIRALVSVPPGNGDRGFKPDAIFDSVG